MPAPTSPSETAARPVAPHPGAPRGVPAPDAAAPAPADAPLHADVSVARGPAAEDLLASEDFGAAWDALHAACPWRTSFLGRTFVRTWFEHYGDRYTPVVVTAAAPSGSLAGLLVLAAEPGGRRLHVAGAGQCEYQGWLALPQCGGTFVAAALDAVGERFPRARIRMLRLPAGAPVAWAAGPDWASRVIVDREPWHFRDLTAEGAAAEKKSDRRAMKKLAEEAGDVAFEEARTPDEMACFLDDFVLHHDFRHEGAYGCAEFAEDPRKRPFHEALFRAGFLRAFALRAGGRFAAGGMVFPDGDVVRQGPHTYAPDLSRHQVTRHWLHAQLAALSAEGFASYDLTPGGGYKERWSGRCETSCSLEIDLSAAGAAMNRLRRRRDDLARRAAARLGWTPDDVRAVAARFRSGGLAGVATALARRVRSALAPGGARRVTVFTLSAGEAAAAGRPGRFRVNCIEDLRRFEPDETGRTRRSFLASAAERMAEGHDVYTLVLDDRLVAHGWMSRAGGTSRISEVGVTIHVPEGAWVLYDFHTAPEYRRRGLYEEVLRQALADAASRKGCRDVWIGVADDRAASRRVVERIGWRPMVTIRRRKDEGPAPSRSDRALHSDGGRAQQVVQSAKRLVYRIARAAGLFALARCVTRHDLRILCYHGFEIDGEHEFAPRLFMRTATFESRLDSLARGGWNVLPLGEAVGRLRRGDPLSDAVVLTIDDGAASVLLRAAEPLARRGLPATLYVTTYHVMHPRPVFQTALGYLLWRTDRTEMDLTKIGPFQHGTLRLDDLGQVAAFGAALVDFARTHLDEPGRQELGRRVAARLGLDWKDVETSRRCSLVTFHELRQLAEAGMDVQLHTHRHRLPADREGTIREIEDNRAFLRRVRDGSYAHLCYPSGEYDPVQFPWLREVGVESATTCETGLNPPGTEPLALRRILDGDCVTQIEFEAELSGFADLARRLLGRRRR